MRTIGKLLKESRQKKKYSRKTLEEVTKIKKEFIESLEKEDWKSLPEYPVVQGFVKSIAGSLNLNQRQVMALLRRDYPPKKLRINPKPDLSEKFRWSPRLTFLLGVIIVSTLILGYLGYQYNKFISPPVLQVYQPQDNQEIKKRELVVSGTTDHDAVVRINNQPVLVEADGNFSAEIEIFEGTYEIVIKATSRSGKETEVRRKIIPRLEE